MEVNVAVAVLCIAAGGIGSQWLAWRFKIPAIVLLFAMGLAAGPGLQLIHPSAALGSALRPLVGLAVAIVVFEGGLSLNFRDLRAAGEGVLRLTAVALPINWVLGTVASHWIAGFSWGAAILFGAITVVTGPTVVLPLLRQARLQRRAASFLRWEAIVNDPVGAILTALTLEALAGSHSGAGVAGVLIGGVAFSAALGIGAGVLVKWSFGRDLVPEFLKTPMLLALILTIASLSNLVMAEAGLMAATVFGIAVANLGITGVSDLRRFKESLVVLLVSTLFVTLTADLDRSVLSHVGWGIAALTAAMIVLARPAAILLATLGTAMSWQEKLLTGWVAPRGIVAAAMAGVAGLRLQEAGYAGADLVMPAVFALIAATMLLHGFSLAPLARRLGLDMGEGHGVLIVGASRWATDFGLALQALGANVTLSDTFPGALRRARLRGLAVLQAEVLSHHGEEQVQERPIDYAIAATPDEVYNGLVCAHFAPELGRERVYQLAPSETDAHTGITREVRGKALGDTSLDIEAAYRAGARFETRTLTEETETLEPSGGSYPLALVRASGDLSFVSPEAVSPLTGQAGDRVVSLVSPPALIRSAA